jgi:hypothetical protein
MMPRKDAAGDAAHVELAPLVIESEKQPILTTAATDVDIAKKAEAEV